MKRLALPAAAAAVLVLGMASAWGAGFGPASPSAVLGRALDFAVAVRLEAGEELEARCVRAEVTVGDRSLPAALVGTAIERTSASSVRVRVQTSTNVDEPVVAVVLHVGCQSRLSRRFVVLADPPEMNLPAPPLATMAAARLPAAAPIEAAALAASPPESAAPRDRAPAASSAALARSTTAAAQTKAAPAPAARRVNRTNARRDAKQRVARVPKAAPQPVARLQLDAPTADTGLSAAEMLVIEQALQAVADASTAVRSANAAASAAEQRAQELERGVDQMRADTAAARDAMALMRERLQASESRSNWVWPLVLGLLALGALAVWLALQLASLRREQRRGWQAAKAQALGAATAEQVAARAPAAPAPVRTPATPAWPPPAPAAASPVADFAETADSARNVGAVAPWAVATDDAAPSAYGPSTLSRVADIPLPVDEARASPMERTLPLPPDAHLPLQAGRALGGTGEQAPLRDLSIEELIDLEQQAEFFIVLGQDEAAIELLVEHVRSTGGSSPLPYLKLLEVYQRTGDREAFERTRQRFNQRFNAYAAEWGTSLEQGRGLQDYPGVLPRLTQAWARPLDAMAELEALLFRKSRGELFDLPAYREVLFLYALARDLLDREAVDTGNVDLLLPLADGGDFGVTSPHPYFGLDHDSVFDRDAAEERPTSPVDLDLSQGESSAPIVDALPPRKPRGRTQG